MADSQPDLPPGDLGHRDCHQGDIQIILHWGKKLTPFYLQASQHIYPGKMSLLQTTQILVAYILVTSLSPLSGLDWLDMAGVILVVFTVLAIFFEERIVDTKRWRWF